MYRLICSPLEEVVDQFVKNYEPKGDDIVKQYYKTEDRDTALQNYVVVVKTTKDLLSIYEDNDILNIYHTIIIVADVLNDAKNRQLLKNMEYKFYYIVLVGSLYQIQSIFATMKKMKVKL